MTLLLALLLTVSPEDDLRSKDAFVRAQNFYKQGRFLDAIHTFEESGRLKERPAVSYNLGRCYEELNETGRALFYYREYVKQAPTATDRPAVESKIAAMTKKLAGKKLQLLAVSVKPEEATIAVDGQRVGVGHAELEVPYGVHELKISASGHEGAERSMNVTGDEVATAAFLLKKVEVPVQTVTVPLVMVEPAQPPADAPVKQAKPELTPKDVKPGTVEAKPGFVQQHRGSLVAGAIAIVGAGVGIGLGASSAAATEELRSDVHNREFADGLVGRATGYATGANVSYGVAGAAAVTAIVLFLLETKEPTP